jgi:hypothetical protein
MIVTTHASSSRLLRFLRHINCLSIMAGMAFILSSRSASAQTQSDATTNAPNLWQPGVGTNARVQLQPEDKADPWNLWTLGFAPEYYYWQENANGAKLLDESGIRYALTLSYKIAPVEGWLWAAQFKVYYGSVNYDGQTQGGTPLKTTTVYYGGLGKIQSGYRWNIDEHYNLDVVGGFGFEDWLRSLNGPGGYNENWRPISFSADVELIPKANGMIATLGVKVPFYTTQVVELGRVGGGDVTLHPGTLPSPYAEAGYQFNKHLSLVAYFDSYLFAKSPTETTIIGGSYYEVYQPQSETYQVGAKLGWTF